MMTYFSNKSFRNTWGPLALMVVCPPTSILMWYTNVYLKGSVSELFYHFMNEGFFLTLYKAWGPIFWGSTAAWTLLAIFIGFEIFLMKCLPGKEFRGPVTPKGNVPVYKANGVWAFATTLVTFCILSFGFHLFPASILYDHFGELLGALNIFSLVFCLFLYVKGRFFPSSSDCSVSHNPIFDFYWGTELFPRVLNIDLKMLTNCRFGMMGWPLLLISYAAKQGDTAFLSNGMLVAVLLQLIYVGKFFVWETGYLSSLDIMHDRAGFYICWGCLVWVPSIYTSPTLYLVQHPIELNQSIAFMIFALGCLCIVMNYMADRQRQLVRQTMGTCKVWGKTPLLTKAIYVTADGKKKETILLASGFWGIARHFHYVPEIGAALCWTLPAQFTNFLPYFYATFLTILLLDRTARDDKRCSQKYGNAWEEHCKRVPYKIMPYVW